MIGSNQFIYPLSFQDRRYCNIAEADENHVKLTFKLAYSDNELDLTISKRDDGFSVKVERFLPRSFRNYSCNLYFNDQLLLEGIGGKERRLVGLEVGLEKKPIPRVVARTSLSIDIEDAIIEGLIV